MSGWLDGYGGEPSAPAQQSPPSCQPITCPKCKSDQIRVRSSDRGTSYLQCLDCGHGDGRTTWKTSRKLKRVIIGLL